MPDASVDFGERHGSWFLQLSWQEGDLWRSAELALTNPQATPDDLTITTYVTVRASASTDSRYVTETLYDNRRSSLRLWSDQLQSLLLTAVQRARGYNPGSLTESYLRGTGEGE
jgi:hypothetical protein